MIPSESPPGGRPLVQNGQQPWFAYGASEHALWADLLQVQRQRVVGRSCMAFERGLAWLKLDARAIPRFDQVSSHLSAASGWSVTAVDGLLPPEVFFEHLAARRFPVTWWLRPASQRHYIQEPDLFHDLFGHLPLLCDRRVAEFVRVYAHAAVQAVRMGPDVLTALTRVYWYTIEFGLLGTAASPRIYGAGLLSSFSESEAALASAVPVRRPADWVAMMRTPYTIDRHQGLYFLLPSLDALLGVSVASLVQLARSVSESSDWVPDPPAPSVSFP